MPQPNTLTGFADQLESKLLTFFTQKAPALPKGVKEFIVKIAPYLVLIGLILLIPSLLFLFGLGSFYGSIVTIVVTAVLELMALPGLYKRLRKSWQYLFYSQLVGIASQLIQLNIVGALFSALIGFYFLFQIREYYK